MIRLNRKLEYATIALKHMKDKYPGQLTSAKEISDTYSLPFDVTAKTLQLMAKKGLLKSEHGPDGGYQIIKDLTKISLLDLIEMVLGPVEFAKCLGAGGCDMDSHCNIKNSMGLLKAKLLDFYRGLSLWDLLTPNQSQTRGQAAHSSLKNAVLQAEIEVESLR
jgi:Rrf2 family transcriptional regulator, nitric oxide-sensitive transcriptional repressor